MLVYGSRLKNMPIIGFQESEVLGWVKDFIIDPDTLKILGFKAYGRLVGQRNENILDVKSIREYSPLGIVVDSLDEMVTKDDVVKIAKVLDLGFALDGLKVETKKGTKLGKVTDFSCTTEDFVVQQIVVKRPAVKAFLDPELIIPRKEVVEITDYKIIIKDEEKTIKKKAETTEFVPNFVNPFRKSEPDYAPAQSQSPDAQDTE